MTKSSSLSSLRVHGGPSSHQGWVSLNNVTMPCALGRSGRHMIKREGDGRTPLGRFALLYGFYRADRLARPVSALPLSPIHPDMGWCDASGHAAYNSLVQKPFAASHEDMWRADGLYDVCLVMDYNLAPALAGRGSAIFFHIARSDGRSGYKPTEGCVAVSLAHMRQILAQVRPGTAVVIG